MPRITVGTDPTPIYVESTSYAALTRVGLKADVDLYIDSTSALTADNADTGGVLVPAGAWFEDTLRVGGGIYGRVASGEARVQYIVRRNG